MGRTPGWWGDGPGVRSYGGRKDVSFVEGVGNDLA